MMNVSFSSFSHRLCRPVTAALLAVSLLSTGCAVVDRSRAPVTVEAGARWALLPLANHTETPQAGLRAEAMLEALLRQQGVQNLSRAPSPASANDVLLLDPADRKVQQDAQRWAAEQGIRYAVTGTVDEWRYKVGVDGEPAVGLVLQVIDLSNGAVVWTATGARSGWSREALSGVAQKLMRELLGDLKVVPN